MRTLRQLAFLALLAVVTAGWVTIGPQQALLSGGASKPTYAWDFARSQALPPGGTFTRASSARYFDGARVLQSAGNNVARFDHDPLTAAPLGYLAEMQSTNAVLRSQALTGANWAATGFTVADNAQASPDGTTNASTFAESGATSARTLVDTTSLGATSGNIYGFSFFAKGIAGTRWAQFCFGGGVDFINVDPVAGTIGTVGAHITRVSARQLTNGWWRFSGQFTAQSTGGLGFSVGMVPATNSAFQASYAGDGASKIAVWGVQFETAGVGVTSYIPTAGAAATRAQDALLLPLTSLPGWNPAQGGVLVAAYRLYTINPTVTGYNQFPLYLNDGSVNNSVVVVAINGGTAGTLGGYVFSGGVSLNPTGGTIPAPFARHRNALGWAVNRATASVDGALVQAKTGTLPLPVLPTTLDIGRYGVASLNGAIESIAYYRGARSDAFVQQVSR